MTDPLQRAPDQSSDRQEAKRQAIHALFETLTSYTSAVVVKGKGLATGTCLSFAGRSFIVTADHVVQSVANSEIYFIPRPRGSMNLGSKSDIGHQTFDQVGRYVELPIVARWGAPKPLDVAGLEVPKALALQAGFRFFSIEDSYTSPQVGQSLTICGFPYELAKEAKSTLATGFGAIAVPISEADGIVFPHVEQLPVVEGQPFTDAYDSRVHFLLKYSRQPEDDLPGSPKGLSGAGVWEDPPPVSMTSIWSPDRLKLAGIEVAWFRKSGLMVVTRADVLLDLLRQSCSGNA